MTETKRRVGRPSQVTLDQILSVIPTIGLENLTLQAVASALNVTAPALYRHVKSKSDLEVKFVDAITAKFPIQPYHGEPWEDWADRFCRALYDMYAAVPGLADFSIRQTLTADSVLERHENSILAASGANFDAAESLYVTRALIEFVASWVAREQRREGMLRQEGQHPDDIFYNHVLEQHPGKFPNLAISLAKVRLEPPSQRFDFTLRALIAGLVAVKGR